MRTLASNCGKRLDERMKKRFKNCKEYKIKEKVFVRISNKKGKKTPNRRVVVKGTVMKKGKNSDTYKIRYKEPFGEEKKCGWFSVEDLADLQNTEKDNTQSNFKNIQQTLLNPMTTEQRLNVLTDQGYDMVFNPAKDGNCQFEALAYSLNFHGVSYITPEELRERVVKYLESHPLNLEGFPLELYVARPWSEYLNEMSMDGSYGDHFTLQAVSDMFGVSISVISSLGNYVFSLLEFSKHD